MSFRRIIAVPVLGGVLALSGVVALAATTFADPAPDLPAVGGQLFDPNAIQIVVAPPASAVNAPPASTTSPSAPATVDPVNVTPPTPPAVPGAEPSDSTASPPTPDLVTNALGLLGLPTTPCAGPNCDQTEVGCTGAGPFCLQLLR